LAAGHSHDKDAAHRLAHMTRDEVLNRQTPGRSVPHQLDPFAC
jgi:hypothetical protein